MGAVLFMFKFIPEFGVIRGIWYGVFHSISAFCNAGYYRKQQLYGVCETAADQFYNNVLIVSAGIGFTVWHDVASNIREV